jgi:hypothetical protein
MMLAQKHRIGIFIYPILALVALGQACKPTPPGNIVSAKANTPIVDTVVASLCRQQLHVQNGRTFYRQQPFDGVLLQADSTQGLTSYSSYAQGWQHGTTVQFYTKTGRMESQRWYTRGEKDSLHTGWWPNGNKRFAYRFCKGQYQGPQLECYESGEVYKVVNYHNGQELAGKGWRPNGRLFLNYSVRNGRYYGRSNGKMCYEVKRETVVYKQPLNLFKKG